MAVISYRNLIINELAMDTDPESVDMVDTHWERFSTASSDEQQYLLAKRAVARTLLAKARKKVDTQIGFDQIKASQTVTNLKSIIEDITNEIEESFPELSGTYGLTSLSSELGLYSED